MSDKESLIRFGVSMPEELLLQFDQLIESQGYGNRSEAIRDMVRRTLLEQSPLLSHRTVAGTVVMVYEHHVSGLSTHLTDLQHDYGEIISTMHIHLNHQQCMEIIVVRGRMDRLRELTDHIRVLKGVLYSELSVTHVSSGNNKHHHEV